MPLAVHVKDPMAIGKWRKVRENSQAVLAKFILTVRVRCSSVGWVLDVVHCWYKLQIQCPGTAVDFLPESTVSADSLTVFVQLLLAITCINNCVHIKIPKHRLPYYCWDTWIYSTHWVSPLIENVNAWQGNWKQSHTQNIPWKMDVLPPLRKNNKKWRRRKNWLLEISMTSW